MKRNTKNEIIGIFKMLDAGMKEADIMSITGSGRSTIITYKSILNGIRNNTQIPKCYMDKPNVLEIAYEYLGKPMPVEKPAEEKPQVEATTAPQPAAADNSALYFIKVLENIKSVDEHLCQLMDADLPRSSEKISTAVEALNINVDTDVIVKEMRSMTSVMAQTIRESIRSQMAELVAIEKENRNTLCAIKNSVQRIEGRKK